MVDERTEQSNADSPDSHLSVEPASANEQELDSKTDTSSRTRLSETGADLADRMSSEEAENGNGSKMVSGHESASEAEDGVENKPGPAEDRANLKRNERKRLSRIRNGDDENQGSSDDEAVSSDDDRSEKSTNTEDYRSQKYIETEKYRSQEFSDTSSEQSEISDLAGGSMLAGRRKVG